MKFLQVSNVHSPAGSKDSLAAHISGCWETPRISNSGSSSTAGPGQRPHTSSDTVCFEYYLMCCLRRSPEMMLSRKAIQLACTENFHYGSGLASNVILPRDKQKKICVLAYWVTPFLTHHCPPIGQCLPDALFGFYRIVSTCANNLAHVF